MKLTTEEIAEVVYQINRAYHEIKINEKIPKPILDKAYDYSMPEWNELPQETKIASTENVEYRIQDDISTEEYHKKWMTDKLNEGWSYGKEINIELKLHPFLLPFELLSEEQRVLGHTIHSVIKTLVNIE